MLLPLPGSAAPAAETAMPNDVLVVEDDVIIALDFETTILDMGVQQVRTATDVARALAMIAERAPDFALLDIGLGTDTSFAVADQLDALKIPFAFVTGYRDDIALAGRSVARPVLNKPFLKEELAAVLAAFRSMDDQSRTKIPG